MTGKIVSVLNTKISINTQWLFVKTLKCISPATQLYTTILLTADDTDDVLRTVLCSGKLNYKTILKRTESDKTYLAVQQTMHNKRVHFTIIFRTNCAPCGVFINT